MTTTRRDAPDAVPTVRTIELQDSRRDDRVVLRMRGTGPRTLWSPLLLWRSPLLVRTSGEVQRFGRLAMRRHRSRRTMPRRVLAAAGIAATGVFVLVGILVGMSLGAPSPAHTAIALALAFSIYTGMRAMASLRFGRETRERVLALGVVAFVAWTVLALDPPGIAPVERAVAIVGTAAATLGVTVAVAGVVWGGFARSARRAAASVVVLLTAFAIHGAFATTLPDDASDGASAFARDAPRFGHVQVAELPAGWSWHRDGDAIDVYHEDRRAFIDTWWRTAVPHFEVTDAVREHRSWQNNHADDFHFVDVEYLEVLGGHDGARMEFTWRDEDWGRVRSLTDIVVRDGTVYYSELRIYERGIDPEAERQARALFDEFRIVERGGEDTIECQQGYRTEVADLSSGGCSDLART